MNAGVAVLGHTRRLAVLDRLHEGDETVAELSKATGFTAREVVGALFDLHDLGLVDSVDDSATGRPLYRPAVLI